MVVGGTTGAVVFGLEAVVVVAAWAWEAARMESRMAAPKMICG